VIARLRALSPGSQLLVALTGAAVVGAIVALAPPLTDPAIILACAAVLAVCAVLAQWLWQHHHGTDWSNEFVPKAEPRGGDPRITRLAEQVDRAVAGDVVAQIDLHEMVRALAEERLRRRRGITLDTSEESIARARAALGPQLAAYLTNPPTTRLTVATVDEFVTTLEEL